MDSEVFLSGDFGESGEKTEDNETFISRINFSWVRIFICLLVFCGLIFCKHFYTAYYIKTGEFYSARFKNDDEKISEMKGFVLDKLDNMRLKIKLKINSL
ncbi:MAG: hypothetical protein Q4D57_04400 [Clostridia bacterium]|nr:hypothetical protein [Clostridia bacterium]